MDSYFKVQSTGMVGLLKVKLEKANFKDLLNLEKIKSL
jgi:hypothetical protein